MDIRESLVVGKKADSGVAFELAIGEPRLIDDKYDGKLWACDLTLDPLVEVFNPAVGVSPFHALLTAIDGAFQLIRDEMTRGDRIFRESAINPGTFHPVEGMTLKQFFERDY